MACIKLKYTSTNLQTSVKRTLLHTDDQQYIS